MANDARTIVVTGTGSESGTPDRCEVHFALNVLADTPGAALDQVSALAAQAITALRDEGVDASKIQMAQISVQDRFDAHQGRVTGRLASYAMKVKAQSIEEGSRVLGTLGNLAGDALQVHGVSLSVADPEPLRAVARRRAVEDAMTRAREIAGAAQVRLGDVVAIEEVEGFHPGRPFRAFAATAAMSGGSPPMEPGSLSVDVHVVMTVAIAD